MKLALTIVLIAVASVVGIALCDTDTASTCSLRVEVTDLGKSWNEDENKWQRDYLVECVGGCGDWTKYKAEITYDYEEGADTTWSGNQQQFSLPLTCHQFQAFMIYPEEDPDDPECNIEWIYIDAYAWDETGHNDRASSHGDSVTLRY